MRGTARRLELISLQQLLLLLVLMVIPWRTAGAMFNSCSPEDVCIDIGQCDRFGPYHREPSKWSVSLRDDFRRRVCQRELVNGANVYKVCCPKPAEPQSQEAPRKSGLDLLDLENCGAYSEDRIAFGKNAKLFQFPWMALLRSQGEWICGGTLINSRYVLTAAHCVRHKVLDFVRLGEFDLSKTIDCDLRNEACAPPPQDVRVELSIPHEDYSPRRKQNDIALLRLIQEVALNDNVMPICLPVSPAMRTKLPTYFVAGWGSTENSLFSDKLQFTEISLVPADACLTRLRIEDPYVRLYDTQVCAKGVQDLSDNCVGDSGGPLKSVSVGARYVQYGVVSFGLNSCGKKAAPGVYTRLENYIDWILDNLQE